MVAKTCYQKAFNGLWLGGRPGADNHPGLFRNQINCRISCLPEKSKLKPAPTTASGQKDFLKLEIFDFNYYIGDIGPQTLFGKE